VITGSRGQFEFSENDETTSRRISRMTQTPNTGKSILRNDVMPTEMGRRCSRRY